jgi:hypothetical protein
MKGSCQRQVYIQNYKTEHGHIALKKSLQEAKVVKNYQFLPQIQKPKYKLTIGDYKVKQDKSF